MKGVIIIDCRILLNRQCEITDYYDNSHQGIDLVGKNYTLDKIIAHTSGTIIALQDGENNNKGSYGLKGYGNFIKIKHDDNYSTLYAHLAKGLKYKLGDYVKEGDILGDMSDSGNAYGSHLHFEVFYNNKKINPYEYLNNNLTKSTLKYNIGDKVNINGVYISSTSNNKLTPKITTGTITKIINNTPNPYLLDNGNIGWINESCIITSTNYLKNSTYTGVSIVDALKEINIDSSYQYRSKLASLNNINNYQGTATQNTYMLRLLKEGKLKY